MVTWDQCRKHFGTDGSLRDIYVQGGGLEAWRALMKVLAPTTPSFETDGEPRPMPATVEDALQAGRDSAAILRARWGGILLCCHFFDASEVELDLDPRDVDSPDRFAQLLTFMQELAREAGHKVILTPENEPEAPFLEVTPNGKVGDVWK